MALLFGTGGMRGIMGEGEDRFNAEAVACVTEGLARYLRANAPRAKCEAGVAIAYDTRHQSRDFAHLAASTLESSGIPAYVFSEPTPTPTLSFAVREMGCAAGIVITASHNPKEYNGYKVYNEEGCQLVPHEAEALCALIDQASDATMADAFAPRTVPPEIMDAYLAAVLGQRIFASISAKKALRVVYTPLHGAGDRFVRAALAQDGFSVIPVEVQQAQNGDFPTVRSPNPEEKDALLLAIERAHAERADIALGTDPDCDRVGAAVLHQGEYRLLSGNQMGALLMDFIIQNKKPLPSGAVVKTIVTNDLGAAIAREAGLSVFETLTGFKYIGEKMTEFARTGSHRFVFGYEESYGYLVGDYARDKDGVVASMLICEMAAWHKREGRTLIDALDRLMQRYGFYLDALKTITISELSRSQAIMELLRERGGESFSPKADVIDYGAGVEGLPKENVLKFVWTDRAWLAVRPSGTEPKLKIYYAARGDSRREAEARLEQLGDQLRRILSSDVRYL